MAINRNIPENVEQEDVPNYTPDELAHELELIQQVSEKLRILKAGLRESEVCELKYQVGLDVNCLSYRHFAL